MIIEEGLPNPLGGSWNRRGTNFALFSANATKVEVCIFDGVDGKHGRAQTTGIRRRADNATVLLVLNSYEGPVGFKLPEVPDPKNWRLLVDTNSADEDGSFEFGTDYEVTGRSLFAFLLEGARSNP